MNFFIATLSPFLSGTFLLDSTLRPELTNPDILDLSGSTPASAFWLFAIFAFIFGAAIGSFLNVVIYRVPAGQSIVLPASHCPYCQTPIRWYDNIPLLAWSLWLNGRCRHCKANISSRYFFIELFTAIMATLLWIKVGHPHFESWQAFDSISPLDLLLPFGLYFIFISLLIVITFVDLDHFLIPHQFTFPGMIIGVATAFLLSNDSLISSGAVAHLWPPVDGTMSIIGLFSGGIIVFLIYITHYMLRGVEGLGGGDITLMALMGAWLGWPALVFIFFAASIQGTIAAVIGYLLGGKFLKHSSEILAMHDAMDAMDATQNQQNHSEEISSGTPSNIEMGSDNYVANQEPAEPLNETIIEPEYRHDTADGNVIHNEDLSAHEPEGGLAVPFGPFIALAGLEFFFLGPYLPPIFSMSYLYPLW